MDNSFNNNNFNNTFITEKINKPQNYFNTLNNGAANKSDELDNQNE